MKVKELVDKINEIINLDKDFENQDILIYIDSLGDYFEIEDVNLDNDCITIEGITCQ